MAAPGSDWLELSFFPLPVRHVEHLHEHVMTQCLAQHFSDV